ncbi:MAG: Mur ligase family protein [Verrucomicrobiota bacterium]
MKATLRQITKSIDLLDIDGSTQREVSGLAYDARRVRPGDIYFALERGGLDGHREIELAVERGAVAVVCRQNGSIRQGATKVDVADTRIALAQAAEEWFGQPGDKLQLIGITGHPGQSNIAFFLKQILENAGLPTGLISTVRHEVGERKLPCGRLYPEASDIQRLLAGMVEIGCGACVIEIPAEELSEDRFIGVPFDVFIFAGPSKKNEVALRWLEKWNPKKSVCSVLNGDTLAGQELAQAEGMQVHVAFGIDRKVDVHATAVRHEAKSTSFELNLPNGSMACEAAIIGRHNLYHVLAAAGAAVCLDVAPAKIAAGIHQLKPAPGNLELVSDSPLVYVDEARTPQALELVLSSLREARQSSGQDGRVLLVLGCEERTTLQHRQEAGRVAGRYAAHVVLTSDNPGREPVEQICSSIARGIESTQSSAYHFQPDRALAIREAVTMAREGDVVIVAGKGERTHQEFASTIVPFDDREQVRECVEQNFPRIKSYSKVF